MAVIRNARHILDAVRQLSPAERGSQALYLAQLSEWAELVIEVAERTDSRPPMFAGKLTSSNWLA
ncbi:MAG: hypothetical protein DCC67_15970 [Planctomycetota bacterium]|nr:MAG: hypothetical protein DCC67_15970 [Planctomycetota bacterium]